MGGKVFRVGMFREASNVLNYVKLFSTTNVLSLKSLRLPWKEKRDELHNSYSEKMSQTNKCMC